LRDAEDKWDYSSRLALMEETKSMPWQAVWDYVCARNGVAVGADWLATVKNYETEVLATRK
jgi:L-rhamnose isomerase